MAQGTGDGVRPRLRALLDVHHVVPEVGAGRVRQEVLRLPIRVRRLQQLQELQPPPQQREEERIINDEDVGEGSGKVSVPNGFAGVSTCRAAAKS